jgi:hypothetical protein
MNKESIVRHLAKLLSSAVLITRYFPASLLAVFSQMQYLRIRCSKRREWNPECLSQKAIGNENGKRQIGYRSLDRTACPGPLARFLAQLSVKRYRSRL